MLTFIILLNEFIEKRKKNGFNVSDLLVTTIYSTPLLRIIMALFLLLSY